jgi:AraC-like DNA-binding protein
MSDIQSYMRPVRVDILPPSEILKSDVECFSIVEYTGDEALSISVSPKAVPGIVFQHHDGQSALESIITDSGIAPPAPTLFLYGPGIKPSVMNFVKGPYTSIQIVLKPHALSTLLGINASALTDGFVELNEFSTEDLNSQLLDATNEQKQVALLTNFLVTQLKQERTRDEIVEKSLELIHRNITGVSVRYLLEQLSISERHFERRFRQTIGVSPQAYIRVKRFNEAIRLIKSGQFGKLTDIAYALDFYDQSHLIRDINSFSSITPKDVARKGDDFFDDQVGYSYL